MQRTTLPALAAALLWAACPAGAATIDNSFTGTFARDDEVRLFAFATSSPGPVTLVSYGYAGGVNAAGQPIPRGGFDPVLALFDGAGLLIAQADDGGAAVPADALTGATFDFHLTELLAPGSYTITLAQFDSAATGPTLADGFARAGQADFTTGFGCTDAQPLFNDLTGLAGCGRTGAWAFDVRGVAQAEAVTEPSTLALLGAGLLALSLRRRR